MTRSENIPLFEHIDDITNTHNKFKEACVEVNGCFFHGHECHLTNGKKIDLKNQKYLKWMHKFHFLNSKGIYVFFIFECEYLALLEHDIELQNIASNHVQHPFYKQVSRKLSICSNDILNGVISDDLFGFVCVDIYCVRPYTKQFLDWPPIYICDNVSYDDWSPYMQENYKDIPKNDRKLLIQCLEANHIVLTTPMLRYYLEKGLCVKTVHWAVEYVKGKPYQQLVDEGVEMRRYGDSTNNSVLSTTSKLKINIVYGVLDMARVGHKNVKYSTNHAVIQKNVNSPSFSKLEEVDSSFYEITSSKKLVLIDSLTHHSFYVLAYSKIVMLKFVYDFVNTYLQEGSTIFGSSDTDSVYMGLSGNGFLDIVKPEYIDRYLVMVGLDSERTRCGHRGENPEGVFLTRLCCISCSTYDSRQPGLFKLENSGMHMVCPCSKRLILCPEIDSYIFNKISFAGGRKTNFTQSPTVNVPKTYFLDPLTTNKPVHITNLGIKSDLRTRNLFSYKENRTFLGGFYIKRQVESCGLLTTPIDRVFTKSYGRPSNCEIIFENHDFSLNKTINFVYKGLYYKTPTNCIYDICKNEKLADKVISEVTSFISWLFSIKRQIYRKEMLSKYCDKILLFPGSNKLLTTGVSTSRELFYIDYKYVKGSNYLNNVFHSICEKCTA